MTHDEAMRLAREIRAQYDGFSFHERIVELCDHILSGDYKREIENAAFERAAKVAIDDANLGRADLHDPSIEALAGARILAAERIANGIAALIQPPAQQKDSAK